MSARRRLAHATAAGSLAFVLMLAQAHAQAPASAAQAGAGRAAPRVEDGFSFAAGGDLIGPNQPLERAADPGLAVVARHFSRADLGFANMEGSLFDLAGFKGWQAAETGGGYPIAPAAVASDLRGLGITVVSKANNHGTDWGTEGLVATLQSLWAAGVAEAGAGMTLAQARAPVYLRTRHGLAALVDTASTFPPMSVACPLPNARYGSNARGCPGISALHVREVHLLPYAQFDQLRTLLGGLRVTSLQQSWSGELDSERAGQGATDLMVGDTAFRGAPARGITWEMNPEDLHDVIASVREARRHANFVLFSIHAHEITPYASPAQGNDNDTARPASFEPVLFHAAIDAGADAVVRNGPHVPGGIELYKGKPIFYSLGSLFFQFGGTRSYKVPGGALIRFSDAWFQTFVPVTTYRHGEVSEIRLYPMVIESSHARTDGRPRPADAAQARRILERVQALSAPYGTRIRIVGGVGIIRGPGWAT
ncbi:MAG TPA: CapA family protein [Steroidobacteraceae bacterium]|nr:CapA family protein [Steroidobacteraceae bacterium]